MDVRLALPADARNLEPFQSAWNDLLPGCCAATSFLTAPLLEGLLRRGIVLPEKVMRQHAGVDATLGPGIDGHPSQFYGRPASPLGKDLFPLFQLPGNHRQGAAVTFRDHTPLVVYREHPGRTLRHRLPQRSFATGLQRA